MSADDAGQLDKGDQAATRRHRYKALQLHASVATRVAEDLAFFGDILRGAVAVNCRSVGGTQRSVLTLA